MNLYWEYTYIKLFSVLYLVLHWTCATDIQNVECHENVYFRDLNINKEPQLEILALNKIHCASECGKLSGCLSFLYHKSSQLCKLYPEDFVNPSDGVQEPGWRYYYGVKDCHLTEDLCPVAKGYYLNHSICFCYKLYTARLNYNAAVASCASDGTKLAKITRYLRQTEVERIMDSLQIYGVLWIQGARTNGGSTWTFDDGSTLTFFNWNIGQPESRGDAENVIVIKKHENYKWHDIYQSYLNNFLCEFSVK